MKTLNKPILFLVAILGLALNGCGKADNGSATSTPSYQGNVYNPNYPGGVNPNYPGGVPIGQAIPIYFQAAYIDSANISAGMNNGYGYGYNSGYGYGYSNAPLYFNNSWRGLGDFNRVELTATPIGNGMYQLQGTLTLSQAQANLLYSYGMMNNGQVGQITAVALTAGHYNDRLYSGSLRVMVNGSTSLVIQF